MSKEELAALMRISYTDSTISPEIVRALVCEISRLQSLTAWVQGPRVAFSSRCPVCHDFALYSEQQWNHADGRRWMCNDCHEYIFGATTE